MKRSGEVRRELDVLKGIQAGYGDVGDGDVGEKRHFVVRVDESLDKAVDLSDIILDPGPQRAEGAGQERVDLGRASVARIQPSSFHEGPTRSQHKYE